MTKRLATTCLTAVLMIGFTAAFLRAQDADSLKGISAVFVLVEDLPDGAKVLGLTKETIQTDVELKLRLAGLHVATTRAEGFAIPGAPRVYVSINLTNDARAAHIGLELEQNALLERNGQPVYDAATWSTGIIVSVPTAQDIRDDVKDRVDSFLNAWLSVNPKK